MPESNDKLVDEISAKTGLQPSKLKLSDDQLRLMIDALKGQDELEKLRTKVYLESGVDWETMKSKSKPELLSMQQMLETPRATSKPSVALPIIASVALIITVGTLGFVWSKLALELDLVILAVAILSGLLLIFSVSPFIQLKGRIIFEGSKTKKEETQIPAADESSRSSLEFRNSLLILLCIMGIAAVSILIIPFLSEKSYGLPLSIVISVVFLLVSLTSASMIFKHYNMNCDDEAMGLPRGSIRALIALGLILIFAIMAVFLYSGLSPQAYFIAPNNTIAYQNGTIIPNSNGTFVFPEVTQAQKDFSSQTLTTVSTLVVAIAAFYFGSRSVETAGNVLKGGKGTVTPEIDIKPSGFKKIKKKEQVTIRVTTDPTDEKVNSTILSGDDPKHLKQTDLTDTYIYDSTEAKGRVILNFALASNSEIYRNLVIDFQDEKPSVDTQPADKTSTDTQPASKASIEKTPTEKQPTVNSKDRLLEEKK